MQQVKRQRECGGRKRKCSAYLSDTDTHINGTDCAAAIAPAPASWGSYLNYIYMALLPSHLLASSSTASSLALSTLPTPAPKADKNPSTRPKRITTMRRMRTRIRIRLRIRLRMRMRMRETTIQIHSWKSEQIFVLHFIIMSKADGFVYLTDAATATARDADTDTTIQIQIRRQLLIPDTFNVRIEPLRERASLPACCLYHLFPFSHPNSCPHGRS